MVKDRNTKLRIEQNNKLPLPIKKYKITSHSLIHKTKRPQQQDKNNLEKDGRHSDGPTSDKEKKPITIWARVAKYKSIFSTSNINGAKRVIDTVKSIYQSQIISKALIPLRKFMEKQLKLAAEKYDIVKFISAVFLIISDMLTKKSVKNTAKSNYTFSNHNTTLKTEHIDAKSPEITDQHEFKIIKSDNLSGTHSPPPTYSSTESKQIERHVNNKSLWQNKMPPSALNILNRSENYLLDTGLNPVKNVMPPINTEGVVKLIALASFARMLIRPNKHSDYASKIKEDKEVQDTDKNKSPIR